MFGLVWCCLPIFFLSYEIMNAYILFVTVNIWEITNFPIKQFFSQEHLSTISCSPTQLFLFQVWPKDCIQFMLFWDNCFCHIIHIKFQTSISICRQGINCLKRKERRFLCFLFGTFARSASPHPSAAAFQLPNLLNFVVLFAMYRLVSFRSVYTCYKTNWIIVGWYIYATFVTTPKHVLCSMLLDMACSVACAKRRVTC